MMTAAVQTTRIGLTRRRSLLAAAPIRKRINIQLGICAPTLGAVVLDGFWHGLIPNASAQMKNRVEERQDNPDGKNDTDHQPEPVRQDIPSANI